MLILGENEKIAGTVSVRQRGSEESLSCSVADIIAQISGRIQARQ